MIKRTKGIQLTGAALRAHEKAEAKAALQRKAKRHKAFRSWITGAAVAFIATVAAVVSFDHIRDLAILGGQDGTYWYSPASLYPLTVDLLMIVASFKLRETGVTRLTRLISRISMWIGLAASLAGNAGTAILLSPNGSVNWLSTILAGWPVIPLFLATEMLTHTHKDAPVTRRKTDGIVALARQIVRQWFVNKLANMKRRNAFQAPKVAPAQVTAPAAAVAVVVQEKPAELPLPSFPQFRVARFDAAGSLVDC